MFPEIYFIFFQVVDATDNGENDDLFDRLIGGGGDEIIESPVVYAGDAKTLLQSESGMFEPQ